MNRGIVQGEVRPERVLRAAGGAELGADFFHRGHVGEALCRACLLDHLSFKAGQIGSVGGSLPGSRLLAVCPLKLRVSWPRQGQLTPLHLG